MSNGLKFEYRGVNRVANKFRTAAAKFPKITNEVMGKWAKGVRAKLKSTKYPAPRPGQTYQRTGRLANSWNAAMSKLGTWIIGNSARSKGGFPYPVVVVGDNQGRYFKGRWWIARDIIDEEIPNLTGELSDRLAGELK